MRENACCLFVLGEFLPHFPVSLDFLSSNFFLLFDSSSRKNHARQRPVARFVLLPAKNYQKTSTANTIDHFMRKPETKKKALAMLLVKRQPSAPSLMEMFHVGELFVCLNTTGFPILITHLDGEFALREVLLALLGLLQLSRGILGGQTATNGTGLLGAEIEGLVLLALEEQAHVVSLLGVDDGKDTSDRLAEVVAV